MPSLRPAMFLLLLIASAATAQVAPSPWRPKEPSPAPGATQPTPVFVNSVRDTGQFLPDTVWLCRVDDRVVDVGEYIDAYFGSYAEFRPKPDSLGRVEFLRSLINKDLLALTARASGTELGFEERATMREHTQRVLSNVVYQRLVVDSVKVDEPEVRAFYAFLAYEQHLQHILFEDHDTAAKARAEIAAGRVKWADAVKRWTRATNDVGPEGDMGWVRVDRLGPALALRVFPLKPGQMSDVIEDREGFHLVRVTERRALEPPAYQGIQRLLRGQLQQVHAAERSERVQDILRARTGLVHDDSTVAWVAGRFKESMQLKQDPLGVTLQLGGEVPEIAPADTGRTLARWKDGRFSVGDLIHEYMGISPLLRPSLNTPDAVTGHVDGIVLEPYMAEYGRGLGLDKDPLTVRMVEERREQLLVERMYRDSISSRVWVSRPERREFYEKNKPQFVTYPTVEFAAIVRHNKSSADSLAAALRAGADPAAILHADSLRGVNSGSIQSRRQNEHGAYHKMLFEEMRPGQVRVEGPDHDGDYAVVKLLSFDAGRQLSFEESEQYADESLQNMKSEKLLNDMLERLRKKHAIAWRPELVMRVRLVDPTLD